VAQLGSVDFVATLGRAGQQRGKKKKKKKKKEEEKVKPVPDLHAENLF
jgi:hypothetical protein